MKIKRWRYAAVILERIQNEFRTSDKRNTKLIGIEYKYIFTLPMLRQIQLYKIYRLTVETYRSILITRVRFDPFYSEYYFMFQHAFPCIKMHLADQGEPNLAKKGKCYGYGSDC